MLRKSSAGELSVPAAVENQWTTFTGVTRHDFADEDVVISARQYIGDPAVDVGERFFDNGRARNLGPVFDACEVLWTVLCEPHGQRFVFFGQYVDGEAVAGLEAGVHLGLDVHRYEDERGIQGEGSHRVGGHALRPVLVAGGYDGHAGREMPHDPPLFHLIECHFTTLFRVYSASGQLSPTVMHRLDKVNVLGITYENNNGGDSGYQPLVS